MSEEKLHEETWSWMLLRTEDGLRLDVLCGTVGVYERSLMLTPEEVALWERSGAVGLEPLVEAIRNDVTDSAFGMRYLR